MKLFRFFLFSSIVAAALPYPLIHLTAAQAADTVIRRESTTTTQTSTLQTHGAATVTAPAIISAPVSSNPVSSTVVTEKTTQEKPIVLPGTQVVNFMAYDANHDGILSMGEVGEMLFGLYDADGNQVIDNKEFERRAVLTVTPVEKTTVIKYDYNNDGIADQANYTYESFLRDTQLSRFDQNKDGLSPHEFTGREFIVADVNNDKVVDLQEWKGSYTYSIDKKNKEASQTNK